MQQQWTIPGTTLTGKRSEADQTGELFQSLFLAGGLTLSQVCSITGLEPHTVQNWVKRGFLSPPQGKKYTMEQVCRLLNINLLKGAVPIEQIGKLMAYLNGDLADERDDLVDDTMLYFFFVRLAARVGSIDEAAAWDAALAEVTKIYEEPVSGAKEKLINVLRVMLTLWSANRLIVQADRMMEEMQNA